jgi:gamma-butyrobetaine dioxygenase
MELRGVGHLGHALFLDWEDGHRSRFHAVWLRDNCPEDRDPTSGQRRIDIVDVPANPQIESADVRGNALLVSWKGEDRTSRFPLDWLRANCYCDEHLRRAEPERVIWTAEDEHKLFWGEYHDVSSSPESRLDWLQALDTYGIVFMRNVPARTGEVFQVAKLIGYVRETNYGKLFDVRSVPNPNNLTYTDMELPLHTNNPYREPAPGIQVLLCLQPSAEGGENIFADGFAIARELRREDPDAFRTLARTPVSFSFRDATTALSAERPIISLDRDDEVQAVYYNNRAIAPLHLSEEEVPRFYAAYRKFAKLIRDPEFSFTLKLAGGDLVALNNRRLLHGRKSFDSRHHTRHLQGCYVDMDGLRSNLAILALQKIMPAHA